MQSTFDTSKLPAYFSVENIGTADVEDMLGMWESVLEDDLWRPGTGVFIDNRHVQAAYTYEASPDQVADLLTSKESVLGSARIAIVMPLSANDRYMREFEALVNSKLSSAHLQYFYSYVSALNWIYSMSIPDHNYG